MVGARSQTKENESEIFHQVCFASQIHNKRATQQQQQQQQKPETTHMWPKSLRVFKFAYLIKMND